MKRSRALAVLGAALWLHGCAYLGAAEDFDPRELARGEGWIASVPPPFIPQESESDCGAAAMAMALRALGLPASREEVLAACPPETQGGIRAGALRDYARGRGLRAFVIAGRLPDLEYELARRRPVIVGLVKPQLTGGVTHYEVVHAVHPQRRLVVTLDPARGWRRNSFEGFEAEWQPAGRPTLVLVPAGARDPVGPPEIPRNPPAPKS